MAAVNRVNHRRVSSLLSGVALAFGFAAGVAGGLTAIDAAAATPQKKQPTAAVKRPVIVPADPQEAGQALLNAVGGRDEVVVRALLDAGVDPNFDNCAPLHAVALTGDVGIARILLEKGADANGGAGRVLSLAAYRGHGELVDLLLDNPWSKANPAGNEFWPSGNAAREGHNAILRRIIAAGADVNGRHGFALVNALVGKKKDTVDMLLNEFGADPNAGNGAHLGAAIETADPGLVNRLLEKGANPDLPLIERRLLELLEKSTDDPDVQAIVGAIRTYQIKSRDAQAVKTGPQFGLK